MQDGFAMQDKLNWDDLRVLLHVGRSFTLAAAAKEMAVDPSTLSRRIARLEQSTNARLFVKTQQGYALTDRGERLMEHASAMEDAARAAASESQNQSEGVHGTIRIGAPDGSANFLLPKVCQDICAEHPDLNIQILALPRVLNLSKGEADMAVTVSPPTGGRVTVQRIADYHLHLAASQSYLSANPEIKTKADLKEHPIIGYIPDLIFDKELDYQSEITQNEMPNLSSNSVSVQINMIAQGAGVGFIHDFAMPFFPQLRRRLIQEIELTRSFFLVRHVADRRVAHLNRFAEILVTKMRKEIRAQELACVAMDG